MMRNVNVAITDPAPSVVEAYIAREMANFALENSKLIMHQITVRTNPGGSMEVKMANIPSIGEEILLVQASGREQVYRVRNVRHNAYPNHTNLKSAPKANITIWCERVQTSSL
jgi:hypothetical protein